MFNLYVVDTECTGLRPQKHSVIEVSIKKLSSGVQKTWLIKALDGDEIEPAALRVNGHKLEDITWASQYGKDNYIEAVKAFVDIENWMSEDDVPSSERIIVGHNANFDKEFLLAQWEKTNSVETFPFSPKYVLDTMQIELFMDLCKGELAQGYSLNNLVKKYGVINSKAHTAAADVAATAEVLDKQIEFFKKVLNV